MNIIYHGKRGYARPTTCDCEMCIRNAQQRSDDLFIVAVTPPQKRTIRHQPTDRAERTYFLPFPWMAFCIGYSKINFGVMFCNLGVYGANSYPKRIQDRVFPFLMPNTGANGDVCLGDQGIVYAPTPEKLVEEILSIYWGSCFYGNNTHWICDQGKKVTMDRLQGEPDTLLHIPEQETIESYLKVI